MLGIRNYYRPGSVDEALALLQLENACPLAGGQQVLVAERSVPLALVDLQVVGLDGLTRQDERLHIGAMVRLQQLVDSALVHPLLADAARREGPLTYRNAATVGGTVATNDACSRVLLALLALDAEVQIRNARGSDNLALDRLLDDPAGATAGGLIVGVTALAEVAGTGVATVARTPRDRPIVAAVVRLARQGGVCTEARIALGGVAGRPLRARDAEALLSGQPFDDRRAEVVAARAAADLQPPADFRGTAEYRREMAAVLTRRALQEAWSKSL
jgi:carbon-monoxide dehydrogenase medium subunit